MDCELMLTYDTPALRQTGSRNLTGQKTPSHDIGYLYQGSYTFFVRKFHDFSRTFPGFF